MLWEFSTSLKPLKPSILSHEGSESSMLRFLKFSMILKLIFLAGFPPGDKYCAKMSRIVCCKKHPIGFNTSTEKVLTAKKHCFLSSGESMGASGNNCPLHNNNSAWRVHVLREKCAPNLNSTTFFFNRIDHDVRQSCK